MKKKQFFEVKCDCVRMGKCMSASSELESGGGSNTDQLISPDVTKDANNTDQNNIAVVKETQQQQQSDDNDKEMNNNNTNDQITTSTSTAINTGSLSESEDDETEQDVVNIIKIKTKSNEEKENEIEQESLNYIKPTMEELENEKELELAHISHRGHYLNQCQYSAQNMLQKNDTNYISVKGYNFNHYDENDNDWIIVKICSNKLIKITSLIIDYAKHSLIQQYPSKISLQFMSSNSLQKVLSSSNKGWSKSYMISPNPLITKRPKEINKQHSDSFNICIADQYLSKLKSNKQDQYIRISFIDGHNDDDDYNGDKGKFAVNGLKIYGIDLLNDDGDCVILENTMSAQKENKNYKIDIKNDYQSKLQPKPGIGDARIQLREHIFFINTENKTFKQIKQTICDEYNRFTFGDNTYQPKQLLLIESQFGLINDMIDSTISNKTLKQIGVKNGQNKTGYYITVAIC